MKMLRIVPFELAAIDVKFNEDYSEVIGVNFNEHEPILINPSRIINIKPLVYEDRITYAVITTKDGTYTVSGYQLVELDLLDELFDDKE